MTEVLIFPSMIQPEREENLISQKVKLSCHALLVNAPAGCSFIFQGFSVGLCHQLYFYASALATAVAEGIIVRVVHRSVCPILTNVISQERLDGFSLHLAQMSTGAVVE